MPIVGIKDCRGGPPKSGIPVRLPPQNICDVNPYVCRMTPASIDFKSEPPFVGRLSFEPHPRGCQCCAKASQKERESYQRSSTAYHKFPTAYETAPRVSQQQQPGPTRISQSYQPPVNAGLGYDPYERPVREPSVAQTGFDNGKRSYQDGPTEQRASPRWSRMSQQQVPPLQPEPSRASGQLTKKQKKMQAKNQKKLAKMERKREQRLFKQQKKLSAASNRAVDYEKVRLLREQRRRDDFVTACCTGLLLTPCVSAGSCSEEADEREQANFYIQCKCCPAARNGPCEHKEETRRSSKRRADFPCQCRNCKYQDKGCTNRRTGCLEEGTTESPVCYCTDEEKLENRQHRVCEEETHARGAKAGQRGFYPQGDSTACDDVMPTRAALLTCSRQEGDACTKMVMTAELMQEMLIQQAQQGIQLANSLLTNKRYQLVDVTIPSQTTPLGQTGGYRSQPIQASRADQKSQAMQTSGSSRSTQPVELNDTNLKCYLQNIDPPETVMPAGLGQIPLDEPLPRPPLNAYQSEPRVQDFKQNTTREHPAPTYQQTKGANFTSSNHGSMGTVKQPKGAPYVPSNQSSKMIVKGEYPSQQFRQPEGRIQVDSYVPPLEPPGQPMRAPNGITGHICIPRDALLQDPMNPKLCIPLSFDPRLLMGMANCPFVEDHVQAEGAAVTEPGFTKSSTHRVLQKEDSQQKFAQGSQLGLKQCSHQGLQQDGSQQGLGEGSRQGVHKAGSIPALHQQKESSAADKQELMCRLQEESARNLQELSSARIKKTSDREQRRRDSDREKRKKDSDQRRRKIPEQERRERDAARKRESDSSQGRTKQPTSKPKPQRPSKDFDTVKNDPSSSKRHKRSISPCLDSESERKGGSDKRRPSPTEMVRTLNGYETDLLQAMDKVKGKYLKKRGNETSSSKGSSFDSMTPGLAEFNCLLKHISCLRKELNKYSKDDTT